MTIIFYPCIQVYENSRSRRVVAHDRFYCIGRFVARHCDWRHMVYLILCCFLSTHFHHVHPSVNNFFLSSCIRNLAHNAVNTRSKSLLHRKCMCTRPLRQMPLGVTTLKMKIEGSRYERITPVYTHCPLPSAPSSPAASWRATVPSSSPPARTLGTVCKFRRRALLAPSGASRGYPR